MMNSKHILIVDDDPSILLVLQNSLKLMGSEYQIVTASDGFTALDHLYKQRFDLVITDYYMSQMDGLELMEAVRHAQSDARQIMVSAYLTNSVQAEAERLEVYKLLHKPLDINAFRQIVEEALTEPQEKQPSVTALSDQTHQEIDDLLTQLRRDVSAQCIFLTDPTGCLIARTGDTGQLSIETITSLLGGGMASLLEVGRVLDNDPDAINLAYHEGSREYLYAVNIGSELLLTIIINRGRFNSKLGSVWYYTRQVALKLQDVLKHAQTTSSTVVFDDQLDQAFGTELDNLFGETDF